MLGILGGYCYLNASMLRILGHRTPGLTADDIDAQYFGAQPGIPPFEQEDWHDRPDLSAKVEQTIGWILTTESLDEVLADQEVVNGLRTSRPDLSAMSNTELVAYSRSLGETYSRTCLPNTSSSLWRRRCRPGSSLRYATRSAILARR